MQEFQFQVPQSAQLSGMESTLESICIAEGLHIGMKGSLATFPGSIHWHFKKPGERGVLEITSCPREKKLWASIQAGRRANWIEPSLMKIKKKIESHLLNPAKQEAQQCKV